MAQVDGSNLKTGKSFSEQITFRAGIISTTVTLGLTANPGEQTRKAIAAFDAVLRKVESNKL